MRSIQRSECEFRTLYFARALFSTEKYSHNDPICKLIPPQLAWNQNHRICQSVLGSAAFKDEIVYISRPQRRDDCSKRRIFFQTPEGESDAARTGEYEEWMVYCLGKRIADKAEINILVSRAYQSGHMFVYRMVPPNYHAYLDNLSSNVSIIDDGGTTVDSDATDERDAYYDDDGATDDSSPIDNNDVTDEITGKLLQTE